MDAPIIGYQVETGVHGARRINRTNYVSSDRAAAVQSAERWSKSNSTGHYWSAVYAVHECSPHMNQLRLIDSYNLVTGL